MQDYQPGTRLPESFYLREDVVQISKDLLGKHLVTCFEGQLTVGRIVETEAYRDSDDKACHAYGNRRTSRTQIMYEPGGHAYIYLCYGIHHLFNIVTAPAGMAHAVLVRAIEPVYGIETMLQRRKMTQVKTTLCSGPGTCSAALGLRTHHTGLAFTDDASAVWIETPVEAPDFQIKTGTRVGIAFAEECAFWPWRFSIEGNKWVGKAKGVGE